MSNATQKAMPKDRTSSFIGDNKTRLMNLAQRLETVNSSVSSHRNTGNQDISNKSKTK